MSEQQYSFENRKLNLISLIAKLEDADVLSELENVISKQKEETDWWYAIGEEERKAVDEGLAQIEEGKLVPHDQVMKEFNERFKEL